MTIFHSIILGTIEGITEFLPVSSTFHLIWGAKLLQLPSSDFVQLFEVAIQSGAILALLFLYFDVFRKSSFFSAERSRSPTKHFDSASVSLSEEISLYKKILLSFLPTAAIGYVLYKTIKNIFFSSDNLMIWVFLAVGLLFFLIEFLVAKKVIKLNKSLSDLSYKQAFYIGLIQSLAVMPGVSRAGIVIVGMMFLRFKRTEAAYYSFFLSIPTIFAASIFDLYKSRETILASGGNALFLSIGSITAFFSAYFTLRWFINFLKKNSLVWFGVYRIAVGLTLFLA